MGAIIIAPQWKESVTVPVHEKDDKID